MRKQHLSAFYFETLLLIAAFVGMILILAAVFGAARAQSVEARQLSQAVTLAANAAEILSASDSAAEAAALLDEGGNVREASGQIEAAYRLDGSPCAVGKADLILSADCRPSPEDEALILCRIEVFSALNEALYTLETAWYRRGAAS